MPRTKTAEPQLTTDAFVLGEGRQRVSVADLVAVHDLTSDSDMTVLNVRRLQDGLATYPEGFVPLIRRDDDRLLVLYFAPEHALTVN